MKISSTSMSRIEKNSALTRAQPFIVSLAFFLVVVGLRSIGAFVLRLDERPDIIFSGVLGFLLVLGWLRAQRKPISSIGLHARNFDKALFIGMFSLVILDVILYGIRFYSLYSAGESPRLVFGAINNETGIMAGLFFSLVYLVGQLFNAFMEESIFRGVILPHLMLRFRFWKASALQATLFGFAHLVFPLSSWVSGQASAREAFAEAIPLLIFTFLGGLVYGYLYYRTDSLWTVVFAHMIDNAAGLFFHIQTVSRLNAETDIQMLASVGFIALTILALIVAKRSNLPILKTWSTS
jgi:membrane protease YdiL (CAAX protease family)